MNRRTPAKQGQVIAALVEGNSIRATAGMTAASKNAIHRLLAASGLPIRHIRIAHFATCLAGKSRAMKFGPAATRPQANLRLVGRRWGRLRSVWCFSTVATVQLSQVLLQGGQLGPAFVELRGAAGEFQLIPQPQDFRRNRQLQPGLGYRFLAVFDSLGGALDFQLGLLQRSRRITEGEAREQSLDGESFLGGYLRFLFQKVEVHRGAQRDHLVICPDLC